MIIRIAKKEELEPVLELLYSCFTRTPREYFLHYVPDAEFPENSIVAVDSGEIVGYVQIYTRYIRTSKGPMKAGGIGNVCIKKNMRGKGIASMLLSYATTYMKNMGYDASVLFASKHRFYVKNGWKLVMVYHYEFDVGDVRNSSHIAVDDLCECMLKDMMEISEDFNRDYYFTVVRDERLWRFQLEYYMKRGAVLVKSSSSRTYALFERVRESEYRLLDFAGDPTEITNLLPEDARKVLFFSRPYHSVTEQLMEHFPYVEKEHVLIFVKPVNADEKTLDDVIFTGKWHYWAFDMF